jgi:hypothetical protein
MRVGRIVRVPVDLHQSDAVLSRLDLRNTCVTMLVGHSVSYRRSPAANLLQLADFLQLDGSACNRLAG